MSRRRHLVSQGSGTCFKKTRSQISNWEGEGKKFPRTTKRRGGYALRLPAADFKKNQRAPQVEGMAQKESSATDPMPGSAFPEVAKMRGEDDQGIPGISKATRSLTFHPGRGCALWIAEPSVAKDRTTAAGRSRKEGVRKGGNHRRPHRLGGGGLRKNPPLIREGVAKFGYYRLHRVGSVPSPRERRLKKKILEGNRGLS